MEHIKGERLPKASNYIVFLGAAARKIFQGFCNLLHIQGHFLARTVQGPRSLRHQPTWKQPCAGALQSGVGGWGWRRAQGGEETWKETPQGLSCLVFLFAHSELSFPDTPLEGTRHQLCVLSEDLIPRPTGQVLASQGDLGGSLGCRLPREVALKISWKESGLWHPYFAGI